MEWIWRKRKAWKTSLLNNCTMLNCIWMHLIICSNCLLYRLVPTSKQAVSLAVFLRWRVVQQVRVYKPRSVQKNQQVQSIRFLKGSHPQWSVACFFHLSGWVFSSLKLACLAQIDIGTHTETLFLEVSTLEEKARMRISRKRQLCCTPLYWSDADRFCT